MIRLRPWDPDNSTIEEDHPPLEGVNWGLTITVGGCLLFWALAVYGLSELIRG